MKNVVLNYLYLVNSLLPNGLWVKLLAFKLALSGLEENKDCTSGQRKGRLHV